MEKKILADISAFMIVFMLFCCIRAGAEEDRRMEERENRGRMDAERKDRYAQLYRG